MGRKISVKVWVPPFLEALGRTGNITLAAKAAGVDRTTVYRRRDRVKSFAVAWDEALETSLQLMEAEAHRRAVYGVERPIYYKGERVGSVREYSDSMLQFLLRAHKPEMYREHLQVEHKGKVKHAHSGAVGLNVKPDLSGLSDAELAELRGIAQARKLEREGEVIETTATEVE